MGSCTCKASAAEELSLPSPLPKPRYSQQFPIGKGSFGQVWKALHSKSSQAYAMKQMGKRAIVDKKNVSVVLNERKLLAALKHPFLVNLHEAYQDQFYLYLIMDYLPGGDLRRQLVQKKTFTEGETRFLIACLVAGLEYLHVNNVVHRDIKPENLVFDSKGYLKITDLGISRRLKSKEQVNDASGTPGYMAPEAICRLPHGKAADFFAVGVIAYECMTGKRPYRGKSRSEIKDAMVAQQVQLKKKDIPEGWSLEAADFINKCLQRKPEFRLGSNGPHEVKNHAWLRNFQWKKLLEETLEAPFCPSEAERAEDRASREAEDTLKPLRSEENQAFAGFWYGEACNQANNCM